MDLAMWIVPGLLALVFVLAGISKLAQPMKSWPNAYTLKTTRAGQSA